MNVARNLLRITIVLALAAGCQSSQNSEARFGEQARLTQADTLPLAEVMKSPDKYNGKYIRVSGEVVEICAKKGCWVNMQEPGSDKLLFVKFTCPIDGERLIPMEAVGKTAIVEGTLVIGNFTEEEARHYAKDAGKSDADIAKIIGPQPKITLSSPAAVIKGL